MGLWSKSSFPATFRDEVDRIREFRTYLEANGLISRLGENGITVLFTQQDVVPLDSSQRQQPESQTPASPCSPSAQHSGAEFEDAASDAASSPDEGADAPTPQAQPLRVRLSSVTLLRFLRARAFQFAAAAKVLEKHVLWRAKVRPEAITSGEIRVPIESGAWTFLGKSKHKRPVLLINAGLWKPEEYPIETYVKFVSFFLTDVERQIDEAQKSEEDKVMQLSATDMEAQQFVAVVDLSEWKLYHAKFISYLMQLVKIVQDQFPERLHACYILNAPSVFWAVWKALSPMVHKRERNKIKWMTVPKMTPDGKQTGGKRAAALETILVEIDDSIWPARYGGSVADVNVAVPNVQGVANVEPSPYSGSAGGTAGKMSVAKTAGADGPEAMSEVASTATGGRSATSDWEGVSVGGF